jgi:acetoin utilization deacetylase AcuC-like enzyme
MDDFVFYYPEGHEAHFERGHPERPERVEVIRTSFEESDLWDRFPHLEPVVVPQIVLEAIHHPSYLKALEKRCSSGTRLDGDTYTTTSSWQLALNAAGGAVAVARAVWRGEAQRGFAITRPPGHHATARHGMGFCLINNVAVAAEYLLQAESAKRMAIIDLDLHHGNGTQDIFYARGDVLYVSTHQYPYYPGTGHLQEMGEGEGQKTTLNLPLPAYSGDRAMHTAMDEVILPVIDRFQPEMILVSTGFDTHWSDPLGSLMVTADGYGKLLGKLGSWADDHCQGRIAMFLEGGYDLDAGAACAAACVHALLGEDYDDPIGPPQYPESESWKQVLEAAKQIWEL